MTDRTPRGRTRRGVIGVLERAPEARGMVSMERAARRPTDARGGDSVARVLAGLEEAGVPTAERRLGRGGLVYARGDEDRHLFFVLGGMVRVHKAYGAFKEATVDLVEEGGAFGESSLRTGGWHRDSAAALTPCRVALVSKAALARHLGREPGCAPELLGAFAAWAERRERAISRLVPREVRGRLAALLLELAEGPKDGADGATAVRARLTHQQLADMVASTREAVSKEMSALRREGLIATRGKPGRAVLLDRRGLREAAGGGSGSLMHPAAFALA